MFLDHLGRCALIHALCPPPAMLGSPSAGDKHVQNRVGQSSEWQRCMPQGYQCMLLSTRSCHLQSRLPMCETQSVAANLTQSSVSSQVWYVVPPGRYREFMAQLKQLYPTIPDAAIALKMLLPLLPPSVVQGLGVRRLVQNPGEAVFTAPVRIRCLLFRLIAVAE